MKLFAVLARERITDEERANIKEFLLMHLNREATRRYMKLFDSFCSENVRASTAELEADEETLAFVGEWALVHEISEQINQALTHQQKVVLIEKIIELFMLDAQLSERQSNLLYHLGELVKVDQRVINELTRFVALHTQTDRGSDCIVTAGREVSVAGCRHIHKPHIDGMLSFLRIAEDELYFMKYLGSTDLSFNGLPLAPGRIYVFPTGSVIKADTHDPVYYSDVVNQFVHSEEQGRLTFIAEDIQFRFKDGNNGIRGVSIAEEGGKLIGIMGSSGSGKTTLLNILNGSERPDSGHVRINGIDLHREADKAKGIIGYVPQDDFLIEELSVYDNLLFAARLCFKEKTDEELDALVKRILRNLGLMEIRSLRAGSPMDKTISGGQRKRLNIGLELLREPTVLFVDEPTSGLSSRDSENIMDLLKELSLRGKMVFVVIHQPSSDIFKLFDKLVIMDVGGFPIYYGNPVEAVIHFKETVNMANSAEGACPECGNINPEQIFNIIETKVVNEFGRFTDLRKVSPQQWNEIFVNKFRKQKVKPSTDELQKNHEVPGWMRQVKVFFQRDLKSKLKNAQYVFINLWEAPLLAIFLATLVRFYEEPREYTYFHNANIPVFIFMSVVVALFMGLTVSAKEIIKDRKIMKREKFLHLSRSGYLVSKMAILFGISAIQTGLFVLISCLILEIHDRWLMFWLLLFSVSCAANLMGLNVSSAFKNTITVYILIPILLIPQLILSGVVISFDKFNPRFANPERVPVLGDWMVSRWSFEGLMVDFYKNNAYQERFYEMDKAESTSRYFNHFYMDAMSVKLSELARSLKTGEIESEEARKDMHIVRKEFGLLLDKVGHDKFPAYDKLTTEAFDLDVFTQALDFLATVQQVYNNRRDQALAQKEELTKELQERGEYDILRYGYHNDELSAQVRNSYSELKIAEGKHSMVRKFEPIYGEPVPRFALDYRTTFYSPEKHFAGRNFPTPWFNLFVIWIMVGVMYATLYYEVPERVVRGAGRMVKW